jgi:xanthine dehydrogenase accessory factor
MEAWLTSTTAPAVLVTVARTEGSVPREAGTKMLVTASAQYDTVGGGHLEHKALAIARTLLATPGSTGQLQRFPLGPGLGQCCGGVVWLLFEPVGAALTAVMTALRARPREDFWRLVPLDGAPTSLLIDIDGHALAGAAPEPPADARTVQQTQIVIKASGRSWLIDPILAPRAHLLLFGAGHVGTALVRALAELPCSVTWIDEREDMFPATLPPNVTVEATDTPEACVAAAPPNASYLVMTHSHALDQRLCEAILRREQVGWFGLIGSQTKRAQFSHRLRDLGLDASGMVCPIGLPGIINKAPAAIAASVAAQLLMVWESQAKA